MRFLLDTNVLSELRKRDRADTGLQGWFAGVQGEDLAISALVTGEIHLGILRLRRRDPIAADHLAAWLTRLARTYHGRTLPVDTEVTKVWADLNAPRPLPVIDSLQAAIAVVHGLTFVTRNVDDLRGVDAPLLNPFEA